jgi:cytochrome b6-f complex iron-sulfur subunit
MAINILVISFSAYESSLNEIPSGVTKTDQRGPSLRMRNNAHLRTRHYNSSWDHRVLCLTPTGPADRLALNDGNGGFSQPLNIEPTMTETPAPVSRRNWLFHALQTSIAATLVAVFYPVVRFLRPRSATSSGALEVVAPYRVSDLKTDAQGRWPPPFNFGGKPCLIIRLPGVDGEIRAFSAVCTHLECTVEFRESQGDIFCNCHNGVYDLNGHNVSGPPPRPLETYKVTLRGEKRGQEEIIVSRNT